MKDDSGGACAVYDKTGREIMIGDVVKVYHFTAAVRRKRHYMYKQVTGERTWPSGFTSLFFSHLTMKDDDGYYVEKNGRVLLGYEIVGSLDARFDERPRNKAALEPLPQAPAQ